MMQAAAFLLLHGYAGVVAYMLARTGEVVEQGGFAGIGVTCQCRSDGGVHGVDKG